jgi:hypothetical protein
MASLKLNLKSNNNKLLIELDANKLERFMADFGFFNADFIKSVERAEKDYRAGRAMKIKSLKDLT